MSTQNSQTESCNRDFLYHVPGKVLFDTTLTPLDLKIYMIVRSFMDTTGKATFASNKWIATKLNIENEKRSAINSQAC